MSLVIHLVQELFLTQNRALNCVKCWCDGKVLYVRIRWQFNLHINP